MGRWLSTGPDRAARRLSFGPEAAMLERVRTVVEQLRTRSTTEIDGAWPYAPPSPGDDGLTTEEATTGGPNGRSYAQLFRCPSCDRVYVATDKRTCSTCNTAVEDVERTDHTALSRPRP